MRFEPCRLSHIPAAATADAGAVGAGNGASLTIRGPIEFLNNTAQGDGGEVQNNSKHRLLEPAGFHCVCLHYLSFNFRSSCVHQRHDNSVVWRAYDGGGRGVTRDDISPASSRRSLCSRPPSVFRVVWRCQIQTPTDLSPSPKSSTYYVLIYPVFFIGATRHNVVLVPHAVAVLCHSR